MAKKPYKNNLGEIPKRLNPTEETLKYLYLKSGNICAFPKCNNSMYKNKSLIGQVCHIEDALPGGRYNPDKSNEQNREDANLLLMCYEHHVETNDIQKYSVDNLKDMKFNHETYIAESNKEPKDSLDEFIKSINIQTEEKFNKASIDREHKQEEVITKLDAFDSELKRINFNRDKSLGCNIPFTSTNSQSWNDGTTMRTSTSIALKIGGARNQFTILTTEDHNISHPQEKEVKFPIIEGEDFVPPFSLTKTNDKLNFSGKVFDYKTEELLGWFNGDEFGVVIQSAFSWNKDNRAVEIIDKYDNVVFSMEQSIGGGFKYKGFFKINEKYYVIGDDVTITTDVNIAKQKIKEIIRVFNHYGSDSLGQRIQTDGKFELY